MGGDLKTDQHLPVVSPVSFQMSYLEQLTMAAVTIDILKVDAIGDSGGSLIIDKSLANDILRRTKRNNNGFTEEKNEGNYERECIEETCTKEEFDETLTDDVIFKKRRKSFDLDSDPRESVD